MSAGRQVVTTVAGLLRHRPPHVHRFRRVGDDPFSNACLYTCRCGQARPGF